ncbi:HesA/MoeB/ThiF family protein [Aureibaculum marinum]|uniref:HesA/MoeB/ThiF family protein n=1 Tax=Aureibaculum marinum TaxID=2487930 RepID=A0A3N4NT17_9FLAO|nr:HesA/MoeB/ThiF family protein [Aureibaculum marinum]RPD97488.1 HesA/MoeB/ThiF family protein [Aureibaculum marinum]
MNISSKQLFIRQTTLSEVGEKGQLKLQQTRVLIVGCGGLGNSVATSLAASGIGTIHLVDFDKIDVTNLHRQLFFTTEDIGKPKVNILGQYLRKIAPFTQVFEHNLVVNKQTVQKLIADVDYVLDCTDSLPTKYLLNDTCVLENKPFIYGSIYKFDGYVASFNILQKTGEFSANLRDAFPEMTKNNIPSCSEIGTLNSIVGIIGMFQSNEVLKLVCNIGKPLINELLIYNSLENTQYKMNLKNSFDSEHISLLFKQESYLDISCSPQNTALLITSTELKKIINQSYKKEVHIISVIEDISTSLPFQVDAKIPLSSFNEIVGYIEQNNNVINSTFIFVCQKGISSYTATQKIKEKYPDIKVLSLKEGISNF